MLTDSDKQFLLRAARLSVESAVRDRCASSLTTEAPSLLVPCGAFVTLHSGNDLRGCIGFIEAEKPLIETVQEVAARAALEDMRFSPVEEKELAYIRIEISVLSPMTVVESFEHIEIGKHGLLIEHGRNRGLLLPQVASEHDWDLETFLTQTARKAGLSPTAWQDHGVRVSMFTAEIFSENDFMSNDA